MSTPSRPPGDHPRALERPHLVPALDERLGPIGSASLVTSDLQAVRRLRYAVFNVELGEGLAGAHETGLDADAFDRRQHLMVIEEDSGAVVGPTGCRRRVGAAATAGTPPASST